MSDPTDTFETWLLQRVAHAVEAGEVSADLLTELQAEIAEAHEQPTDEQYAAAVQELAKRFGLSVDTLQERLAALEKQPRVTREAFLRRSRLCLEGRQEFVRWSMGSLTRSARS